MGALVIHQNRKLKLILPLIGIVLIALLLRLIFVERIWTATMMPMPLDQNRKNNFVASPSVWTVEDSLHLSFRDKTLQVGESGRFRRMNGKRTIATVTDDYYLYGYLDPDNDMFINLGLVRRSDNQKVFGNKKVFKPYLSNTHLYYIDSPYNEFTLMRYSLADGALQEVLPYVLNYCIAGDNMLYVTGGRAAELTDYESRNNPALHYRNLQTGEDFIVIQYKFPADVGNFYADGTKIYFQHNGAVQCFDFDSNALSVFYDDPNVRLLNAYNGKLYFDRITNLDTTLYTHEVFSLDIRTSKEENILDAANFNRLSAIGLSVYNDSTFVLNFWNEFYVISSDLGTHVQQ